MYILCAIVADLADSVQNDFYETGIADLIPKAHRPYALHETAFDYIF